MGRYDIDDWTWKDEYDATGKSIPRRDGMAQARRNRGETVAITTTT
jgi:hypothetical protein